MVGPAAHRRDRRLGLQGAAANRGAIPAASPLAKAEFTTLSLRLLKLGARVVEKAARIRIHFASACPDAALFRMLVGRLATAGP